MARILPLSSDTVSQIQSSKQINSLHGVILSLLENSLDAGSNKIELSCDFYRGACVVEDNGSGIPSAEFAQNGGLGRMYHTSKRSLLNPHQIHGKNGVFLAALASLSLLKITSSHIDDHLQSTLMIHRGKVVERSVSASSHETAFSITKGTCVSVRDLFGNMPVRVKQRALAAETDREYGRLWNGLSRDVVALLLACSRPCSVRIRDQDNENKFLLSTALHPTITSVLTEKNLSHCQGLKPKFDLSDALPLLCQARLISHELKTHWIPVSAKTSRVSLKGIICMIPASTKQCQFISIGVHPCRQSGDYTELYDAVNKIFITSGFGAMETVPANGDKVEKYTKKREERSDHSNYTQRQLRSRKGVDRWPMFVLQINIIDQQARDADLERPSDLSLKAIVDVLESTTTQWLTANHFRPLKCTQPKTRNADQESPSNATPPSGLFFDTLTPRGQLRTSVIATPNTKLPNTMQSATTSKKRKIIDVDTSIRSRHSQKHANGRSKDYFHSWSRIKSGRGSFQNNDWDAKKPTTAPVGQRGTKGIEDFLRPSGLLELPAIKAGALSSKAVLAGTTVENRVSPDRTRTPASIDRDDFSEDYGSFDEPGILAAIGCESIVQEDMTQTLTVDSSLPDDEVVDWHDALSGQTYKVNARTGIVLPSRSGPPKLCRGDNLKTGLEGRNAAAINTSLSSAGKSLMLTGRSESSKRDRAQWLPGFLRCWENPVFARQEEEPIPVASHGTLDADILDPGASKEYTLNAMANAFAEAGASTTAKLSKAMLKHARVIRQVDRKYILCSVKQLGAVNKGDRLIIVDQHAASERVILEKLFSELCTPALEDEQHSRYRAQSVPLQKSLRFDVSDVEHQQFHSHRQRFARWGIVYELIEKDEILTASQVRTPKRYSVITVHRLPPGIAERCALVPKLLIELLRSEIWAFEDRNQPRGSDTWPSVDHEKEDSGHFWLKRIGSCPKGIVEMLNSRACRSAIMFNDELSTEQCEQLLSDLSKCAFPFMCAHGRVSMVPVANLEPETGVKPSFAGACKAWKGESRFSHETEAD